jgi:tellurite methyltransferase
VFDFGTLRPKSTRLTIDARPVQLAAPRAGCTSCHDRIVVLASLGSTLDAQFGAIDIYLFDQLLRGRLTPGMRVFDAGCGTGRNLVYLLRTGYEVFGADANPEAIESVRSLAAMLAPHLPRDNFRAEPLDRLSFPDAFADVVISSAVLHFARDDDDFAAMVRGSWRVLKPGGLFFCRLASLHGIAEDVRPLGNRRFLLPDGSERYLTDEPLLLNLTRDLGGTLLDPLKTTIVHGQRAMTTWVVRKRDS